MNSLLRIFRMVFKYHHEEGNITSNPALKVSWIKEPKTIIKIFQDHEVKAMLKAFSGNNFICICNRAVIARFWIQVVDAVNYALFKQVTKK